MTSSWHHRPCYDVIGFPYIRRRAWPIRDLPHPGLRVHFSSEFDCRVFVHARIDTPMHPCFRSLLPSIVLDTSRKHNLEYSMRHLHRTDLLSVGAHEHYSGCTSLHLRKRITTGVTHHPPTWHTSQFWYPCMGPIDWEWPDPWKVFHLG